MNQPLTPEQTKSAYQRVCEQECEGCADELPFAVEDRSVHLQLTGDMWPNAVLRHPCTAPSKDALIERHAAQITAMQEGLTSIFLLDKCPSPGDGCSQCIARETLSDAVERGKELLGQSTRIAELEAVVLRMASESQRQAVEIEELRENLRAVSSRAKTLVRCGCNGCLTDDCDHWGVDCSVKDTTLCRIGRTLDAAMKEKP